MSDIDRMFINTCAQDTNNEDENKIPNKFCRYEFLEFITRLANQKYREQKIVKTYPEALNKLLDHVSTSYNPPAW